MQRASPREDEEGAVTKRRKVPRACDYCRKRKIRCDGPQRAAAPEGSSKCSHCAEIGMDCTYIKDATRKGPPRGYVQMLQERCARLETMLKQLRPTVELEPYIGPPLEYETFDVDSYRASLAALDIPPFPACRQLPATPVPSRSEAEDPSTSPRAPRRSYAPDPVVAEGLLRANDVMPGSPPSDSDSEDTHPFLLTSSSSVGRMIASSDGTQYYGPLATQLLAREDSATLNRELERVKARRAKLWKTPEWEVVVNGADQHLIDWSIWPKDEIAIPLIDTYFEWANSTLPLLHRPLFRQQYFARTYMNDYEFAKVCLCVFANGAKHKYVPSAQWRRGEDLGGLSLSKRPDDQVRFSDGWKFIRALMSAGDGLHKSPTLCRLQTAVLLCTFLQGNSDPTLPWSIAGGALRATQESGLNVASTGNSAAEKQLFLRAFWCLYHLDRSLCVALGRAVSLHDCDIDARYPLAVDDEHFDDAEDVDPEGRSLKVVAFVHILQLDRIVSAALVALAPARQDPSLATRLPSVVIELVSALSRWHAAVPPTLAWDASCREPQHLVRTAQVHARYHWARIFVHYASAMAAANISAPAHGMMDAALDSARATFGICAALLAHEAFSSGIRPINAEFIDYAWVAAAITLLGLRSGSIAGPETERALAEVEIARKTLAQMECVSRKAGQVADLLGVMVQSLGGTPKTTPGSTSSSRRDRDKERVLPSAAFGVPAQAQEAPINATPDLAWLQHDAGAFFMPPVFGGPGAVVATPAGHTPMDDRRHGGDEVWTHLLENFMSGLHDTPTPGHAPESPWQQRRGHGGGHDGHSGHSGQ